MPNKPERPHLLDDRLRERVGALELRRDRDHLTGDEPADGLDQLAADLGISVNGHGATLRDVNAHAEALIRPWPGEPGLVRRPVPCATS